LLAFLCFFAARFSSNVFAGFFFESFFLSIPLLMCCSSWLLGRVAHERALAAAERVCQP
jgi:hypothetical protein